MLAKTFKSGGQICSCDGQSFADFYWCGAVIQAHKYKRHVPGVTHLPNLCQPLLTKFAAHANTAAKNAVLAK